MRYLNAVLRQKWMILMLGVVGAGVGFGVSQFMAPIYMATGKIWMQAGPAAGVAPGGPIRAGQLLKEAGWLELVRSQQVIIPVIREQKLYLNLAVADDSVLFRDFALDSTFSAGSYKLVLDNSRQQFTLYNGAGAVVSQAPAGQPLGANIGFAWTPPASGMANRKEIEFAVRDLNDIANELRSPSSLELRMPPDQQFLILTLRGQDPARIAATLNAVMDSVVAISGELKAKKMRVEAEILEVQLQHADSVLDVESQRYDAFRVATITKPTDQGVVIPSGGAITEPPAITSYFAQKGKLDELRSDKAAIARALAEPRTAAELVTALEAVPSVRASTPLMSALADLNKDEATLRVLLKDYMEEHRLVVTQTAQRDTLQKVIIPRYARQLLSELEARDSVLSNQVTSAATELREIPQRRGSEDRLKRAVEIADELYRDLKNRTEEAKLAAATTAVPDISVLDRASVPETPAVDPRLRWLLACTVAGLGLGILGALVRDRLDPRLRYPSEVTAGMGLHILGAVPALRRGRIGASDMALAVEAFRAIQLSLMHAHGTNGNGNGGGHSPVTVTFTSPGASDGKSFVTTNLAIAFADMGHRTLVIDGDVRRGTQHQLMGTSHKPGLTDYLAGKVTRAEIVQSTRYPLLDMIGCGSRGEHGPKLLGSPAMSRLIQDLKGEYDVILIDSPPLGACVDPMILGTLTRNMVLILRTGTTDRTMAESKLDTLDRLPIRVIGAILNDVSAHGPYRYYSYMSGYEVIEDGEPVKALEEKNAE
jgi:tyrosine-protein kinase Etk/Wzc